MDTLPRAWCTQHVVTTVINDYAYSDMYLKRGYRNTVRLVDAKEDLPILKKSVKVLIAPSYEELGTLVFEKDDIKIEFKCLKQRSKNAMHLAKSYLERHVFKSTFYN